MEFTILTSITGYSKIDLPSADINFKNRPQQGGNRTNGNRVRTGLAVGIIVELPHSSIAHYLAVLLKKLALMFALYNQSCVLWAQVMEIWSRCLPRCFSLTIAHFKPRVHCVAT